MKKIALTGAAGFIGSNITEKLVEKGYEVTAIDNMHTGSDENLIKVKDKINFVKSDSGDFFKNTQEKFDLICHQGVYSSSPMYRDNPHLTSKAVDEFISILEYAKKHKTKIVYASTSSIYNGFKPPHKESMKPKIKDYYTEARYGMERMGLLYKQLHRVKVTGLRYLSVYGPHEKSKGKYANLVSQFLWAMMKGEKPVVYGDGKQMRDFTYVSDVVEANILALENKATGIFNVGTGRSVSVNDMIGIINQKLGKKLEIEYISNPVKNYVDINQADTSKSKEKLGFEAKVSIEEGIEKLVKYYSERI